MQNLANEAIEKGLGLGGDSSVRNMKSVLEAASKVSGVLIDVSEVSEVAKVLWYLQYQLTPGSAAASLSG